MQVSRGKKKKKETRTSWSVRLDGQASHFVIRAIIPAPITEGAIVPWANAATCPSLLPSPSFILFFSLLLNTFFYKISWPCIPNYNV